MSFVFRSISHQVFQLMVRSCSSCKIVDEIFSLIEYFLVMSGSVGGGAGWWGAGGVGGGGRGDEGCLNCNKKIHSCVVTNRRVGHCLNCNYKHLPE